MELRPQDIFQYMDDDETVSVADSVDVEAMEVLEEALRQVREQERRGFFINKAIQAKKQKQKKKQK